MGPPQFMYPLMRNPQGLWRYWQSVIFGGLWGIVFLRNATLNGSRKTGTSPSLHCIQKSKVFPGTKQNSRQLGEAPFNDDVTYLIDNFFEAELFENPAVSAVMGWDAK